jgi:hypothetical protein
VLLCTVALTLGACSDDGTAPEVIAALEGSWRATRFAWTRVDDPEAESVDLIALGGEMLLDIEPNGKIRMTTREVGSSTSESVLGQGRIVGDSKLELDTGGGAPVTLDYTLAGSVLRLVGRLTLRPAGVGEPEDVDLEAVLIRAPDA